MVKKSEDLVAKEKQELAAVRDDVLTDLFDDLYRKRVRIYRMNFVRGIWFGFGSALGGTVVLAIVVWLLSWTVNWPWIGQYVQQIIN